jgi:hypothetical protein
MLGLLQAAAWQGLQAVKQIPDLPGARLHAKHFAAMPAAC